MANLFYTDFPDAYWNLINNFNGPKKFVRNTGGSNSNNGDTYNTAYQTVQYAIEQTRNDTRELMFIIFPGTYTLTSYNVNQGYTDVPLWSGPVNSDGWWGSHKRLVVCSPGRVILQWIANNGNRDAPFLQSGYNGVMYGAIMLRNNNGRTGNYQSAVHKWSFGYWRNCVFREVNNGSWSLQYNNDRNSVAEADYCTYYFTANGMNDYSGGSGLVVKNSVFTTVWGSGDATKTNNATSQSVNASTYVAANAGSRGVYHGTYSWTGTTTVPGGFYITPGDANGNQSEDLMMGDTFTVKFILPTASTGLEVPYTITGVTAEDLANGSLSGNFVFTNLESQIVTINTSPRPRARKIVITAAGQSVTVRMKGAEPIQVDYLLVGGGGGAGGCIGGGGAGGAMISGSTQIYKGKSYPIVVGGGGLGGFAWNNSTNQRGDPGSSTTAIGLTAAGGGRGGGHGGSNNTGTTSGSGAGGNSAGNNGGGGDGAGGTGTLGQGSQVCCTGGTSGGAGGIGASNSITGTSVLYAAGGGGGTRSGNGTGGIGGDGGGGNGGTTDLSKTATDGTTNSGSGGGGGGHNGSSAGTVRAGGNGGSGVVIIKYSGNAIATGGVITSI